MSVAKSIFDLGPFRIMFPPQPPMVCINFHCSPPKGAGRREDEWGDVYPQAVISYISRALRHGHLPTE